MPSAIPHLAMFDHDHIHTERGGVPSVWKILESFDQNGVPVVVCGQRRVNIGGQEWFVYGVAIMVKERGRYTSLGSVKECNSLHEAYRYIDSVSWGTGYCVDEHGNKKSWKDICREVCWGG